MPPLLLPEAKEKYQGTLDIDIALDFKEIDDQTYNTLVDILKKKDYYQKEGEQPFKYYRDVEGMTIEIDLLAAEYGGTGMRRRHQNVQDAKARKARGCDLVFDDFVRVELSGVMPGGTENKVSVKIASIGPFLVTKGMALWTRMKEKDAFDIYYCVRNYPGGLVALQDKIKPLVTNKLAQEGFGKIRAKFEAVNSTGPNFVADFLEIAEPEEREIIKREAFELINALMDKIKIDFFSE
ncbi:MAG: hypothetical protein WBB37_01510 [bacterium]